MARLQKWGKQSAAAVAAACDDSQRQVGEATRSQYNVAVAECRFPNADILADLTVCRIRAIFRVSDERAALAPRPLSYVEWFTPLNVVDDRLGTYTVSQFMSRRWRGHHSVLTVS